MSVSYDSELKAREMLAYTLGHDLVDQTSFLYPFVNDEQVYAKPEEFYVGSLHSFSQMMIYVPLSKINLLPNEISEFILMNLDQLT